MPEFSVPKGCAGSTNGGRLVHPWYRQPKLLAGTGSSRRPYAARKAKEATIASPASPALFFLNLLHATAHWPADLRVYCVSLEFIVSLSGPSARIQDRQLDLPTEP